MSRPRRWSPLRSLPARGKPGAERDASYLVTGGLGGLGLATAGYLVEQGARHLWLLGRGAPNEAARAQIEALREAGATVHVRGCDVSDAVQLARVLDELRREGRALRGVVHAAGVLADGLVAGLRREDFERVDAPKILGAFHLHRQTLADPLSFFVCYSSAATTLGSPGQANYAAANAFMDALAEHRRAHGLCGLSINWGPWREVGLAVRADRAERLGYRGLSSMSNAEGLGLLGRLMHGPLPNAAVLPAMNVHTWTQYYPVAERLPMFEQLRGEGEARETDAAPSSERERILRCEPELQSARLEAYVLAQVGRVLKVDPGKTLDPELALTRLGIDSLMALELKNRLEAELSVSVPVSKILLGPSAKKLAHDVLAELLAQAERAAPATEIDALSDHEVDSMLAQLLAESAPSPA